MTNLLIGADPEFFVTKDGKFVSAYGLIEGTKKNPLKVNGGAVQVDGMALEFNVNPAKTFEEFEHNFQSVLTELRAMVPKEYEFAFVPVADFDEAYIKNQPEEARMLGCDPDFNAYTGLPNNPPDAAKNFRTASGHLHLGWTENEDINNPEHIDACQMMVKQLDASIGLASVVYDRDVRRRELYGKAGAYRPKSYGVEYRVMSNFWLKDKAIRKHLFETSVRAFNKLIDGNDWTRDIGIHTLQDLINTSNWKLAYDYYHYYNNVPAQMVNMYDEALRQYQPPKKRALKIKKTGWDVNDFDLEVAPPVPPAQNPFPQWVNAPLMDREIQQQADQVELVINALAGAARRRRGLV